MEKPTAPTNTEVCSCEPVSSTATSSSTLKVATTASSVASAVTDKEEVDMQVPGYFRDQASMVQEFKVFEMTHGWSEALREVSDQCQEFHCRVAREPGNRSRNRYWDVSPYDHSRVCLRVATPALGGGFHPGLGLAGAWGSCSIPSTSSSGGGQGGGDGGGGPEKHNDYINASFVVMEAARRKYILTQSPLPNTCAHFWLMAWQQNSRAVIMLSRLVEKNIVKCSQYWPPCQGQTLLFEEIGLSVHLLEEEVKPHHTIHHLQLKNMTTGEVKAISRFHYTNWPDSGVPESPISFLRFLLKVWESGSLNFELGPAVIHCSSGISRSGTFALVDTCLVLMEKKEKPFTLDIRQVLVNMRQYRMGLIQTSKQLRFAYLAVIEGAKFFMRNEKHRKKWKYLVGVGQEPSYNSDNASDHKGKEYRLILVKNEGNKRTWVTVLDSEMPNSGEGSSESSEKKLREDRYTIDEAILQNREKAPETELKKVND